ncbi:CRISPR-associated Csm1 family protein [Ligilactobacillus saerimneri 30a]|uniref:CRISPR system single-strand-specific deoxyribonuclease Cas10/Csm1 (subtype III-A) n=1 Tax=Ligilactobacillus saerimneri 30a TaxID=1227363 RepID=M5J418_9LACO|nr:type III-A CRISPR-associated protein Cas10/Csm1 [Ligilactobacillus saerimneri]EKW98568.1 CRISPR-associated Csm1 family protein [Ligilactobacillus saerimneri 30a]MBU5309081.1 type III-A CRISPR-associated protein Cas10/Csm1 [Ligilactobacillus saerimneri]
MKNKVEKRKIDLFYGALFHDIGKAVMRVDRRRIRHQRVGAEFLQKAQPAFANSQILNSIKYHHIDFDNWHRPANFPSDDLSYITYIADNIASGVDRRKHAEEVEKKWDSTTPLQDVFNRFGSQVEHRYLKPGELYIDAPEKAMPQNRRYDYTGGEYGRGVESFRTGLMALQPTEDYMQSALNLLEATMSFMPSSTNAEEVADISLYDHMKLTAAFALAIQQYLDFTKVNNLKKELFNGSAKFYQKPAFMMVQFELVGIEPFIYTIVSQGAHKQLRSRSFYAEMLSEWFVDTLLKKVELTRANVLYMAGGKGYIIMGNTPKNRKIIETWRDEFNSFLQVQFTNQLRMVTATTTFTADQVREPKKAKKVSTFESYSRTFNQLAQEISKAKQQLFTASEILQLNRQGKKRGRECVICHQIDELDEQNHCQLCAKLAVFSQNIQHEDFFVVDDDPAGLPVGPNAFMSITTEEAIRAGQVQGKIYSKNQLNTGFKQQTYLWVSDYSDLSRNDFNTYAKRQWQLGPDGKVMGIKRLAALRVDVDDLYAGFLAGFADQEDGKYTAISRYATLSRRISSFFKVYLNSFAEGKALTIIYSGGDDLFLIGAWDDVLQFLVELKEKFDRWTDQKMTFSAGVYMYHDKLPINIVARQTGQLLQAAKLAGKDRVALFASDNIYRLDDFINQIYQDKLVQIRQFFLQETGFGKGSIYHLLDLIRTRNEKDRISFARLVYYLSRLESRTNHTEEFKHFKEAMIHWFDNADQIKQVKTALILYLYEVREDN